MYSSNRALPKLWKDRILNLANPMDLGISDHQIIRKNNFYCLNKMKNRELYQIQISEKCRKQISSSYYKGYFNSIDFDWNSIYIYIYITAYSNCKCKFKGFSVQNTKQCRHKVPFLDSQMISFKNSF